MFVQDVMQSNVLTVTPRATLPEAIRLAQQRGIRHLPVLADGRLVGILSDRDLKRAMASPASTLSPHERQEAMARITVDEIMTRDVMTVGPRFPLEEAARLMLKEKISALPVTEDGRLVGIVTETDVLALFLRAIGAIEPSSRLDVVLGEPVSHVADIVASVESAGSPICSIAMLPGREGTREVMIRVRTINPGAAVKALEAKGYTVRDSWRG
jgi:acetoin utilization protein AcuB